MFKPQIFRIPRRQGTRVQKKITIWHLIFISPLLVVMFGFGIWSLESSIKLTQDGTTSSATVTQVQITSDEDGTKYRPTFKFTDEAGKSHSKTSNSSSSTVYKKGQVVEIIYLAGSPEKSARINTFMNLWLLPIILLSVSILIELGMISGYLNRHKYARNADIKDPILMFGATVKSRYWQTVNDVDGKKLEIQYQYQGQTYKTKSNVLDEKQLRKLKPGGEIKLKVNPKDPIEARVLL